MMKRDGRTEGPGRSKSLTMALVSTGTVNVLNLVMGLATGILTARGLETHGRGVLVAIVMWAGTLGAITLVGLDESLVYHSHGSAPRAKSIRRLIRHAVILQVAIGSSLACIAIYAQIRSQDSTALLACIAVASIVCMNAISQLLIAPLRILPTLMFWNLTRFIPQSTYLIGLCILWILGHLSLITGILVLAFSNLLTVLTAIFFDKKVTEGSLIEEDLKQSVISYGRRTLVSTIPQILSPKIDQLLISLMFAPSILAIYSVAVSISTILVSLSVTLEQVLFPHLIREGLETLSISKMQLRILVVVGFTALGVGVASPLLIPFVYGDDYREASTILPILLVAGVIRSLTSPLVAHARANDQLAFLSAIYSFGVLVSCILFFILSLDNAMMGGSISILIGTITIWLGLQVKNTLFAKRGY